MPYVTRGIISFAFVLAGAMFFSVGALLCWHLYLVSTAQTSVELLINREIAADARLRGEVRLRARRSARQADGPVTWPPRLLWVSSVRCSRTSTISACGATCWYFSTSVTISTRAGGWRNDARWVTTNAMPPRLACPPHSPWWFILLPVKVKPFSDGTEFPTVRSVFSKSASAAEADLAARLV